MVELAKIREALTSLDPLDDDQWTTDGAPKVETVGAILGEKVTRQDIVNASPDFDRSKVGKQEEEAQEETPENGGSDEDEQGEPAAPDEDGDAADSEVPEAEEHTTHAEPIDTSHIDADLDAGKAPSEEFTQREFNAYLVKVDKEDLPGMEESLRQQFDQVSRDIEDKRALLQRIKTAIHLTRNRIKREIPTSSDGEAIRDFIKAQTEARAARAQRRSEVLQSISPSDLEPRAPIDAAMARKTKRGVNRPARALMK